MLPTNIPTIYTKANQWPKAAISSETPSYNRDSMHKIGRTVTRFINPNDYSNWTSWTWQMSPKCRDQTRGMYKKRGNQSSTYGNGHNDIRKLLQTTIIRRDSRWRERCVFCHFTYRTHKVSGEQVMRESSKYQREQAYVLQSCGPWEGPEQRRTD